MPLSTASLCAHAVVRRAPPCLAHRRCARAKQPQGLRPCLGPLRGPPPGCAQGRQSLLPRSPVSDRGKTFFALSRLLNRSSHNPVPIINDENHHFHQSPAGGTAGFHRNPSLFDQKRGDRLHQDMYRAKRKALSLATASHPLAVLYRAKRDTRNAQGAPLAANRVVPTPQQ